MKAVTRAYLEGRKKPDSEQGVEESPCQDAFKAGVDWVGNLLAPAIQKANEELQGHDIAFRVDLNLDRQSTNHAHADFWITSRSTDSVHGPKYSLNVIGGREVWLYKSGAPGRILGSVESCGANEVEALLADSAREFGELSGRKRG